MATRKSASLALVALLLGVSLTVPAFGTSASFHTNHLSFSGPVGLPGVTLPAGTYVFERVVDTNADVVVVRNLERSKVYYLGNTLPTLRPRWLPRNQAVLLGEARPGTVPPISAWYPVGEENGHVFVYARK